MKTNQTAESDSTAATTDSTTSAQDSNVQQLSSEEKLERAKNLIEKKRKEKDEENERVSGIIRIINVYSAAQRSIVS